MADIVLINPLAKLSKWELELGSKLPPLGLACLGGYLREKGVSVEIIEACNLGLDNDTVLDMIERSSPAYVGFTATTIVIHAAAELAAAVKKRFPHIKTIVGGPHISALPTETIDRFRSFDIGVYGEGEETLFEIVNSGKIDKSIRGIVFVDGNAVTKTDPRPMIADLDTLPFPAYDLLPNFPAMYTPTPNNYSDLPVSPIVSSRGCPFSCTFCTQAVFGRKVRACSTKYLIEMIKDLQKRYGVKEVCFYDDIFLLKKNTLYDFIREKERQKIDIRWSCEGRIGQFDDQMFRDMKNAGCWQISFGVESGSQTILDYFNKKITVEQIEHTLAATRKAGMRTRTYLIIGAPPETDKTLEETRRLVTEVPMDDIHISYFTPLPGSAAYNEIMGSSKVEDFNKINQYLVSYSPPNLKDGALTQFMNSLYNSFYLHPRRLSRYFLMLFNRHKTIHLLKSFIGFIRLTIAGAS